MTMLKAFFLLSQFEESRELDAWMVYKSENVMDTIVTLREGILPTC